MSKNHSVMASKIEKVAVLMGGTSSERELSLMSGNDVVAALHQAGIDAYAIDTRDVSVLNLKGQGYTKAFIALHGRGGEDGTLQAVLDFLRIPYTGSSVMASAIAMDKLRTKLLWQGYGLPTPRFVWLTQQQIKAGLDYSIKEKIEKLGLPLIVKPSNEGCSFGITHVNSASSLPSALEEALRYDDDILVETFLSGAEYTVGILGEEILPSVRIECSDGFYTYEAKRKANNTQYFCPSGLSVERETKLQALVSDAWRVLGGKGWGRIDVIADGDGNFHLIEVNATPSIYCHGTFPKATKAVGLTHSQTVARILELTY